MDYLAGPFSIKFPDMARWPRHVWTTIFTYGTIFVLFPALCWLAVQWLRP